jgi:hypothetical protein
MPIEPQKENPKNRTSPNQRRRYDSTLSKQEMRTNCCNNCEKSPPRPNENRELTQKNPFTPNKNQREVVSPCTQAHDLEGDNDYKRRCQAEAIHLMHKADCYDRYTTNHNRGHNESIFEKCPSGCGPKTESSKPAKRHRCTVTKLYNRIQIEAIPPKVAIVASATTGSSVSEAR